MPDVMRRHQLKSLWQAIAVSCCQRNETFVFSGIESEQLQIQEATLVCRLLAVQEGGRVPTRDDRQSRGATMVANTPITIPILPPFDPSTALTLPCVCKLGLVPGHDGRRIDEFELTCWAEHGFRLVANGATILFPAVILGDQRWTTPEWCRVWVRFIAKLDNQSSRGRRLRRESKWVDSWQLAPDFDMASR